MSYSGSNPESTRENAKAFCLRHDQTWQRKNAPTYEINCIGLHLLILLLSSLSPENRVFCAQVDNTVYYWAKTKAILYRGTKVKDNHFSCRQKPGNNNIILICHMTVGGGGFGPLKGLKSTNILIFFQNENLVNFQRSVWHLESTADCWNLNKFSFWKKIKDFGQLEFF